MSLHCLYADPASNTAERLRILAAADDAILLLGAAAALARRDHPGLARWCDTGAGLYALATDLDAYGVDPVDGRVQVIDPRGWLRLAIEQPRQLLWR